MTNFKLFISLAFVLALTIVGIGAWQNQLVAHSEPILAKWTQLVPARHQLDLGGEIIMRPPAALVRAVLPAAASCPGVRVDRPDGPALPMRRRDNPRPKHFPIVVCEALVPPTENVGRLYFPDSSYLPVPQFRRLYEEFGGFRRMIFLGDTGCRGYQSTEDKRQTCQTDNWPFAQIATHAAETGTNGAADPFVVIHVGDYVYRDRDTWQLWQKEFFEPAQPLLEAASWIMLRGNHESCSFPPPNSANGWLLLFGTEPDGSTHRCPDTQTVDFRRPYVVDIARDLQLGIVDTGDAFHFGKKPVPERPRSDPVTAFGFGELSENRDLWLVTHVPLWGIAGPSELSEKETATGAHAGFKEDSVKIQAIANGRLPGNLRAVISGDLHYFQLVGQGDKGVPQFVVGNGGVKLDELPEPAAHRPGRDPAPAANHELIKKMTWTTVGRHGYVLACRAPASSRPSGPAPVGTRPRSDDGSQTPETSPRARPEIEGTQESWTFMLWAGREDGGEEFHLHPGLPAGHVWDVAPMPCVLGPESPECTPAARTSEADSEFVQARCF